MAEANPVRLHMERHKGKLVDIIDSEFGLLNILLKNRVLSDSEVGRIKVKSSRYKKNEMLLDYIARTKKHEDFMAALRESSQTHIVNWIIADGKYEDEMGLDWPLTVRETNILIDNQAELVDTLDTCDLLNRMYSTEVINKWHKEFIESKPTNHDKNEALLEIVRRLSRKGYYIFINCLRDSNQGHIADIFEFGGAIVPVHATLQNDNLDELETQIVNRMAAELCSNTTSMDHANRLLAALQLQVIAVKRGESIILYVKCCKEDDFDNLLKVIENMELKEALERLFNLLLHNTAIKVIVVEIFETDLARAKEIFALDVAEQIAATAELASTEKEAMKRLRALSECCICLTTYTDPRMLPCVHTACLKCFEDIQLKNGKKPGELLPCPLCRNEFTIPADGMKGLRKNFFIESLMEATNALKLGNISKPCTMCSMIEDPNNVAKATMRCLICCENYCLRCSKIHKTLKATQDHKIVELNVEGNEEEIRNMFPIRKCVRHSDKVLDYYCSDCKTVVCVSCFAEEHQTHNCKDVTTVDKKFRQRIEQSFTDMFAHKEDILSRKSDLERKKKAFLAKVLETESSIRKKNQQLKALIDQHTKELLNELSLLKQQQEKKMDAAIEEIERKLTVQESFVTYCTELKSKGSPSEVCGSVDSLIARANELRKENEEYLRASSEPFDFEFIATDHNALQNAGNITGKLSVNSLESIIQSGEAQQRAPRSSPSTLSAPPSNTSAAREGLRFPVVQRQAQWFCDYCTYQCSSQNEFLRHSSSVTHQFHVNSDKEQQWNFRQPPWNVQSISYRLCQKHEEGQSCRYSHVVPNRNYCTFAHGLDELDEWKERFRWREMKRKAAAEDNLCSYMAKLVEDYKKSGCEVISEEMDNVSVECAEPLSVTSENKLKVKEWTFKINSEVHGLQAVALLYEEEFLHFALVGQDLEDNCQIADGELFQTDDTEYSVKVKFTGGLFRSFHQWVVFDFGLRPVLVRKLSVDLGKQDICDQLLNLKEEMSFNRWTSLNRKIVKFGSDPFNPDSFAELLARYKEPSVEAIKLQQLSHTQLNTSNYKHRMHALIDLEELAQAKIILTSPRFDVVTTIKVTNRISDELGGMQFSHSGQLFAAVRLGSRLMEGSLMASYSVSTALLGPKDGATYGFVYEAEICKTDGERALKGKDYVYLTLSKKCCEDMKLKDGDTVEVEIQFQLNRLPFCRMHYGIDQLNTLDLLFVDSRHISAPSPWNPKYNIDLSLSKLNEDQRKVISYVSVRRKQLRWPLVVYGPFGTGKTKTLAEAVFLLTTQNDDAKILICARTNQSANEYVLRYFHQMGAADLPVGLLRIYDKSRRINTVDPQILPYCLVASSGNARSFREPTVADIRSRRIVVATLEMSLVLTRLNLRGHFTHIFIDEAAQALECHAVMPLCLADEKTCVVLAGDHIQMMQQVYSKEAVRQNFGVSLVERMICGYFGLPQKNNPAVLFGTNYRNHPEIVKFVGRIFYGGEDSLKSVGTRSPSTTTFPALAFRYSSGGKEVQHSSSTSFYNATEIHEMMEQIDNMLHNWPADWGDKKPSDILVTTAYNVQVNMIRALFRRHTNRDLSKVVVLTVQNVPGKEFRAVFISTVRTTHLLVDPDQIDDLAFDFLSDEKLLNLALTRARSSVTVVGDPVALCGIGRCSKIWREYMKHCAKLNSISPLGLNIDWIRSKVDEMTRDMVVENVDANQPEDWNEEFRLPEDDITQRLRT